MSDTSIQKRRANQEAIYNIQQNKLNKKKELAQKMQEDIQEIRAEFKEETKKIDEESEAAINHIRVENQEENLKIQQERKDKAATYRMEQFNKNQSQGDRTQVTTMTQSGSAKKMNENNNQITTNSLSQSKSNSETESNAFTPQIEIDRLSDRIEIQAQKAKSSTDELKLILDQQKATLSGQIKKYTTQKNQLESTRSLTSEVFTNEVKFTDPVDLKNIQQQDLGDKVKITIPILNQKITEDSAL